MIKTKLFTGYYTGESCNRKFIDIDVEMNEFIAANDIEIVDIKLSVSVDNDGVAWDRALMIYREG
ncbi:hypothetical protein SFC08_13190 [Lysinibacillus halotolerans]